MRLVFVSVLACVLGLAAGRANTYTVNTSLDTVDVNPGDGLCRDGSLFCSLRAAIQEANAQGTPRTITLESSDEYLLRLREASPETADENLASTGDLDVTTTLVIEPPVGTSRTVRVAFEELAGPPVDRIFHVRPGGSLTLRDVTLADGAATSSSTFEGGAILVDPGGTLALFDCTLDGNEAWEGGAVHNDGTFDADGCTFSNNRALDTGDGAGQGGAIWSGDTGVTTVLGSTFTTNRADVAGGAIFGGFDTVVDVENSTFSGNLGHDVLRYEDIDQSTLTHVTIHANTGRGLVTDLSQTSVTILSSILSDSSTANCDFMGGVMPQSVTSLSSDASCAFAGGAGFDNAEPELGDLMDNGGTTLTHQPAGTSSAVDNASDGSCPATDQTGLVRPDGVGDLELGDCDIGAVELLPEPDGALVAFVAFVAVRCLARRRS